MISPASDRRVDLLVFVSLCALGFAIYGWVGLHAKSAVAFTDSMDYVMIADFYRAIFRGESPPGEAVILYRLTRFPPLFPLLIGFAGGGSADQHMASIVSLVFSALAPLMTWAWARRETGSTAVAAVMGFAVLAYPTYFLLSLTPVSEPFALFLSCLALWLLAKRAPESSAWSVAAFVVGVSLLARTALLPLGIALVLVAVLRRTGWRRCAMLAFLSFAPLLLWGLYRRSLGAAGYTTFLTRDALIKELGGFPDALWLQPWRLVSATNANWGSEGGQLAWLITGLITALVIIGVIIRMRRFEVDAFYLAGYFAMILLWPYPFELGRFIVVVYPICLLAAMEGWTWALRLCRAPAAIWRQPAMLAILVAIASGPTLAKIVHRASLPIEDDLLDEKREAFFYEAPLDETAIENAETFARARILAIEIPRHVPRGECVYSMMPQFIALYGRTDSLSFPHDLKSKKSAKKRLTECRYFFVSDIDILTYNIPGMYPAPLIEEWTTPILVSNIGNGQTVAALLRLKDDEATAEKKDGMAKRENHPLP